MSPRKYCSLVDLGVTQRCSKAAPEKEFLEGFSRVLPYGREHKIHATWLMTWSSLAKGNENGRESEKEGQRLPVSREEGKTKETIERRKRSTTALGRHR